MSSALGLGLTSFAPLVLRISAWTGISPQAFLGSHLADGKLWDFSAFHNHVNPFLLINLFTYIDSASLENPD